MWSYYGSKRKISHLYPTPEFSLIIEPFAGAAWYSLLHKYKSVVLNEANPRLYRLWEWLINDASAVEINKHLDFYKGQDIRDLQVRPEHRDLIGFNINRGTVSPSNIVQKWSCQSKSRPDWASTTHSSLRRSAEFVSEIRHWQVFYGTYSSLPDVTATWFIDPPYQQGGTYYTHNHIDYEKLADFCRSRRGQVIVCENGNADWLPFVSLTEITGQRNKTKEVVWTNKTIRKSNG